MSKLIQLIIVSVIGLYFVSCTETSKPNIEPIQNMMDSPAHKGQDVDKNGKSTMRMPPENTLALGKKRYPYGPADAAKAGRELKNPFAGQMTTEILDRGKNRYDIYCGLCHGMTGKGDGQIAEKMPLRPPSLVTAKAKAFKDGRYYHIIMRGQGVMGSYANQLLKEEDRWKVVNYIRSLQRSSN